MLFLIPKKNLLKKNSERNVYNCETKSVKNQKNYADIHAKKIIQKDF